MDPRITCWNSLLLWPFLGWMFLVTTSAAPARTNNLTGEVYLTPCTTVQGEDYGFFEQFLGIPYAEPPIGDLRFRDPKPYPLWTGNRLAVNNTLYCWQFCDQIGIPVSGKEDCLFLHVYRPSSWRKRTSPLNVIVFLHGGGLYSGTNNPLFYGSQHLMETQEVIMVSPTYRSNVFGFLATGDEASPGNYGLKDVILALQWVQDNIGAFGGDPNQVTLMGHNAGSVIAQYLVLSELSKGLFKNVIMASGFIPSPWTLPMKDPRGFANRHAEALGIKKPHRLTSDALVEKFRQAAPADLQEALKPLKEYGLPLTNYMPSIEPKGAPNAVITEDPYTMLKNGDFQKVPIMMTIAEWDGLNMVQPFIQETDLYKDLNKDMYKLLPLTLYWNASNSRMEEIVDKIRFKYFGPTGYIEGNDGIVGLIEMATDYFFVRPMFQAMDLMANYSDKGVYGSEWQYQGENSFGEIFTGREDLPYRPVHGDDFLNVVKVNLAFPGKLNRNDAKAQKLLLDNMIHFAKHGSTLFEAWKGGDSPLTVFRNDKDKGAIQVATSTRKKREDCAFWDYMEAIYVEGQKPCPITKQ